MQTDALNPNTATPQEIFDYVVGALLKQDRPAIRRVNTADPGTPWSVACQYRQHTPEGETLKCGIGHIIPDAEYYTNIEGTAVNALLNGQYELPTLQAIAARVGAGWLRALQHMHDEGSHKSVAEWRLIFRQNAREFANRYGLDASIVPAEEARA